MNRRLYEQAEEEEKKDGLRREGVEEEEKQPIDRVVNCYKCRMQFTESTIEDHLLAHQMEDNP